MDKQTLKKAALESMNAGHSLYKEGNFSEAKVNAKKAWDLYLLLQKERDEEEDFSDLIYQAHSIYEACEGATEDSQLDLGKEVAAARERLKNYPTGANSPEAVDAYLEMACGDVMLAEKYARESKSWLVTPLVKEFVKTAYQLLDSNGTLDTIYSACERIADVIQQHPRLKLSVYELLERIGNAISERDGQEPVGSEHIDYEISMLTFNIEQADRGQYDKIVSYTHLKHEPIEWSERWEDVIDDAEREANEQLDDMPRGMGFCFAYWPTLRNILKEKYNLDWRTPAEMNPGVIFD